ncbi:MAG TPA: phosphotransferase family protein [Pyrinomonadaceae bacterium]|nr:phosphotransferase family protein [Pyrinomonadaceae bacterium]
MTIIPETQPVRRGEELETSRLSAFLAATGVADHIEITQFPAGSSNLTYLIKTNGDEYVLRRPPFGNVVKTAHDMRREFEVLSKLAAVYPPAPKPLLFCDDESVIGSEFYLMERRHGLIIRGRSPEMLEGSAELQRAVCGSFMENLASLHSLDYRAAGLDGLGKPDGYCRRQVEGWTKRYVAAKTHDWTELEQVIEWLNDNIPAESGASLVHNDYKFDNIMLDSEDLTKIVGVLDWEMVTIGDPLMDLGTTLGYWMSRDAGPEMLSMPFNPRVLMENVSRRELVDMYVSATGRDLPDMLFYYVFGTFKIAVIAQQIYARYAKGLTSDERFARFDSFVARTGKIAATALHRDSI